MGLTSANRQAILQGGDKPQGFMLTRGTYFSATGGNRQTNVKLSYKSFKFHKLRCESLKHHPCARFSNSRRLLSLSWLRVRPIWVAVFPPGYSRTQDVTLAKIKRMWI